MITVQTGEYTLCNIITISNVLTSCYFTLTDQCPVSLWLSLGTMSYLGHGLNFYLDTASLIWVIWKCEPYTHLIFTYLFAVTDHNIKNILLTELLLLFDLFEHSGWAKLEESKHENKFELLMQVADKYNIVDIWRIEVGILTHVLL